MLFSVKKFLLAVALLSLAGCANIPDNLKAANEDALVPYQAVVLNPGKYDQKPARWGGVIAEVTNQQDTTTIEVVHRELSRNGRPMAADFSAGRFRVKVAGFLDPVVFEQGRSITFIGHVAGSESGLVGERQYTFPLLVADNYKMWQEIQQVDVTGINFGIGFWPHSYHSYWHGWGRHHFGVYPGYQRVIIRDRTKRGVSGSNSAPSSPQIHPQKQQVQSPTPPPAVNVKRERAAIDKEQ